MMAMMPLLHFFLLPTAITVLSNQFTFTSGQRFSLRGQSYPNHGLVLIDEVGETDTTDLDPNNGLICMSDLSGCCSSSVPSNMRGEFDFPDGSVVPTLGSIRNGYYRNREGDRNILNRRSAGMVTGLFQCRIRTVASPTDFEEFYIGVYDENTGVPTVNSVSTSGLTLTCTSSNGPATVVTWRRNCAVLPNNAMYQQTQTVTQTQIATYQNMLAIDSAVVDRDGVYTCSVTNARGYDSGVIGVGASYEPTLPVTVSVATSGSPVAGGSFTLMCDHGSTAANPTYQWFDNSGAMISTQATLSLNRLNESNSGEYSCLVTDQSDGLVGCGVYRVTVQAPSVMVTAEGVDGAPAGGSRTLTCSISGFDTTGTTVMYTWFRGDVEVQAASTSTQYTIPSGFLGVSNAGDVYTCRVAITADYWDVSGSFGDSGSGTLSVNIPNPTIQFSRLPLVSTVYVGLNVSLRCDARVPVSGQLIGVEAVVEWMKEGARLSSSGDGRITLGDLQIDSPGRDYRRSIQFSPLSAGDMATYSCSAMIIPTVDNPRVTNGFGVGNTNLIVVVPTLAVSIDRTSVSSRILDISPFNGFSLTCTVTSRVGGAQTPISKRITWMRSVDGRPAQDLTDGANVDSVVMVMEDDLFGGTSMSMLVINTTVSGSHSYTCRAELVVAPAPDDITQQDQTNVGIIGPSPPVEPTDLIADGIDHNMATIRWTVPSLSYDLEIYVVQYGQAMDSLTMTSAMVMGDVTPMNYMDDFQGSVTLTGLDRLTTYFYQVMSTNSHDSTLSAVGTFNTSGLAPEPPTMLQCSQVPNDPLSYTCNWMAPTVTNGVLTGYQLECMPEFIEIPRPPTVTPSTTSAAVSNLSNGVNYTCSVRARNEGGLSQRSVSTSFYTMEIAPSGPPVNASVPVIAARVMEFTWQPPAPTMRNGRITGYNLTCFITDTSRTGQISAIYPPQESYTLSGFRPGRQYICQTVAMNSAGNGPPGQITTTSSEDVPDGPPQDIRFQLVTPNQVRFFWSPPLEELQNGLILSYMISCVDSDGARDPITEMVTAESIGMATVSGFIPATLYNCFLSARTVIGFGVSGTIQVLTVPDRPIITTITPNVTSLLVSWTNEGPSITGYYVYLDSQRIHTEIRGTRVNITGLAPFTNYTVEVSAFNTRGDGTEQEGPRSDPRTETTLGELPGPPVCPRRWTTKSLSSLSIDWQPPTNPNGIITSYFLELVSFDNQTVLQSGSESGGLSESFTGFTIAAGIPYHVRIYAENINGRGSYCITTDFGNQLAPPSNILNDFLSSRDSTDSSAILLTWTVLPLDQAKGFVTLSVTFGPLSFTNELEAQRKRQTANECSRSPCQILYEQGRVRITGLDPQRTYYVIVIPQNEEGEIGTPTSLGIPAVTEQQLASTTNNSTAVVAGTSAVIAVLALLLFMAAVVIVCLLAQLRKHKHPHSYELPTMNFTPDRKADIMTTQCEAYEVMKLQEVSQGHTHNDTVPERAYEEVGERLVSDGRGQRATAPPQETTTQQMYEEVAHQ